MKNNRFLILLFCFLFFVCRFSRGQTTGAITFIRFNSYIGYVIDSAENARCSCIKFAGDKFIYGSLIQFPDSAVVFLMKIKGRQSVVTAPMSNADVYNLSSAAAKISETISSEENDEELMKALAGDSASFGKIDFYNLKLRKHEALTVSDSILRADTITTPFFANIGIGFSSRETKTVFIDPAAEFGVVFNKHIFSGRYMLFFQPRFLDIVTPRESIHEFSFFYGKMFDVGKTYLTLSAGISYATGLIRGDFIRASGFNQYYESKTLNIVGVPVKFEMLVGKKKKPFGCMGFFANINSVSIWFGAMFSIRVTSMFE
jgi:hypothetical protein